MDINLFNKLVLTKGQSVDDEETRQLENLTTIFPYCQTGHLLFSKALRDQGSQLCEMKIKTAAAYSIDRVKLKHFLVTQEAINDQDIHQLELEGAGKVVDEGNNDVDLDLQIEETESEKTLTQEHVAPEIDLEKEVIIQAEDNEGPKVDITQDKSDGVDLDVEQDTTAANQGQDLEDSIYTKKVTVEMKSFEQGEDVVDSRLGESAGDLPNREADLILKYLETVEGEKVRAAQKKESHKIIDAFIKKEPVIGRLDKDDPGKTVDFSKNSGIIRKEVVSENMAKIQARQGHYKKAIKIYEQLQLKMPEKKHYFAQLIEEQKKNL